MANDTKKPPRDLTTTSIGRDLAKQVRAIADHRDETMDETLDRVAGPAIQKEFKRVVEEMHESVTLGDPGA